MVNIRRLFKIDDNARKTISKFQHISNDSKCYSVLHIAVEDNIANFTSFSKIFNRRTSCMKMN